MDAARQVRLTGTEHRSLDKLTPLWSSYKPQRAPKIFASQVKEWACTLQPGSLVAVSVRSIGSRHLLASADS